MPALYLEPLAPFLAEDKYFIALDMLKDRCLDRDVGYDRRSDLYLIVSGYQEYTVQCNGVVRISFQMRDDQSIFFAD